MDRDSADLTGAASKFTEYRCRKCGRLLFRAELIAGSAIETVCPRCKVENQFHVIEVRLSSHKYTAKVIVNA